MTFLALIGVKALYLLFIWLLSAAGAPWIADRKGYGERVGLTFGLLLSVARLPDRAPVAAGPSALGVEARRPAPEAQALTG